MSRFDVNLTCSWLLRLLKFIVTVIPAVEAEILPQKMCVSGTCSWHPASPGAHLGNPS